LAKETWGAFGASRLVWESSIFSSLQNETLGERNVGRLRRVASGLGIVNLLFFAERDTWQKKRGTPLVRRAWFGNRRSAFVCRTRHLARETWGAFGALAVRCALAREWEALE
jgi:hypothetical protein